MKLLNKHVVRFFDGNVLEFYTSARFDPRSKVWHYISHNGTWTDAIYTKYGYLHTDSEVRRFKRAGVYLTRQSTNLFYAAPSNKRFMRLLDDILDNED